MNSRTLSGRFTRAKMAIPQLGSLWSLIYKAVVIKLDGVAPLITDPPLTNFTTLSRTKITHDMLHITCDM